MWRSQRYSNVPAVVNVNGKDAPFERDPESKVSSSAVAVCVAPSAFTHVTVVPTGTVMDAGMKRKLWMSTFCVPDDGVVLVGVGFVAVVTVGVVVGVVVAVVVVAIVVVAAVVVTSVVVASVPDAGSVVVVVPAPPFPLVAQPAMRRAIESRRTRMCSAETRPRA